MQKVALITGGARRIGAAIAAYLHANDFKVIIHCNNSVNDAKLLCDKLNKSRPNSSIFLKSNFNLEVNVTGIIEDCIKWGQRLDVVVNNASIFSKDIKNSDIMWRINVDVPYWFSHKSFPYLKKFCGSIINITDSNIKKPIKDYDVYFQTKKALSMQTKDKAQEFAPYVRVNAIAPGAIMWPEGENNLSIEKKQFIISKILLKKHGNPLNIAKTALFLIENDFITGQEIFVDGGRNINDC